METASFRLGETYLWIIWIRNGPAANPIRRPIRVQAALPRAGVDRLDGAHAPRLHGNAGFRRADARRPGRGRARDRRGLHPAAAPGRARQGAFALPRPSPRRGSRARRADAGDPARSDAQHAFAALDLDAAVVAAYGLILPEPILARRAGAASTSTPRCCRAGAARRRSSARSSPATRSPACASWAWSAASTPGRSTRGARTEVDRKTAGELTAELAAIGGTLMADVLERLDRSSPSRSPRTASPTRTRSTRPRRGSISSSRRRGRAPGPGVQPGARRLLRIPGRADPRPCRRDVRPDRRAGNGARPRPRHRLRGGAIVPTLVQRAGRAAMRPDELLRGFVIPVGGQLG